MELKELQGWDDFLKQVKKLGDAPKRTEMNKVLRRVAKPTLAAAKQATPIEKKGRTVTRRTKSGQEYKYEPGNLQKSIKTITVSKRNSRGNPRVVVGPKVGRRGRTIPNDGFYGFFLIRGTKHIKSQKNWIHEAFHNTNADKRTMDALQKYLVKQAKKLGFNAK